MGIANRDYYRDTTPPAWTFGDAPVVKYIIVLTAVVFLLQIFSTRDVRRSARDLADEAHRRDPRLKDQIDDLSVDDLPDKVERKSLVTDWLNLDPNKVVYKGQVWRLVTHAFCHSPNELLHILFNMLFLYWFGRELEALYGSREFLLFYLAAAIVAGLTYIVLDLYLGSSIPAVGASGAVIGVAMLFTLHYPRHVILLFMIIPLEMRWVMLIVLALDLHPVLLNLAGNSLHTGIGHAAHLGGLAFGFLYYRFQWRLDRFNLKAPRVRWKSATPRPRLRIAPDTARVTDADADQSRVDQILAKISQTGQDSLTDEERAVLRAESERIKRRNR